MQLQLQNLLWMRSLQPILYGGTQDPPNLLVPPVPTPAWQGGLLPTVPIQVSAEASGAWS